MRPKRPHSKSGTVRAIATRSVSEVKFNSYLRFGLMCCTARLPNLQPLKAPGLVEPGLIRRHLPPGNCPSQIVKCWVRRARDDAPSAPGQAHCSVQVSRLRRDLDRKSQQIAKWQGASNPRRRTFCLSGRSSNAQGSESTKAAQWYSRAIGTVHATAAQESSLPSALGRVIFNRQEERPRILRPT